MLFLSTPSARRATYDVRNPLKLRQISIHTLREEGDALYDEVGRFQSDFYPRPPRGGRLYSADGGFGVGRISIHALREEGDSTTSFSFHILSNFYPRPPRGGRQAGTSPPPNFSQFLSTPSARRATESRERSDRGHPISIHALREEGDVCGSPHAGHHKGFLSTPSARRATLS